MGGDERIVHARGDRAISIPAPAWGATAVSDDVKVFIDYFNSRPRVGGDRICTAACTSSVIISIPAPAWGATLP